MKPIVVAIAAALAVVAPAMTAPISANAQDVSEFDPTDPDLASPEVRAPLEAYLRGHATGDPAAFREAFHPDAVLWGIRADGQLARMTAEEYISRASGSPAEDEAQRLRFIDGIFVNGDLATATITLIYPTVRFADVMTMIRIDGRWWIVNKMFQAYPPPMAVAPL